MLLYVYVCCQYRYVRKPAGAVLLLHIPSPGDIHECYDNEGVVSIKRGGAVCLKIPLEEISSHYRSTTFGVYSCEPFIRCRKIQQLLYRIYLASVDDSFLVMVDYHIAVWRIFLSEKHKLDTEFPFQFIGKFFPSSPPPYVGGSETQQPYSMGGVIRSGNGSGAGLPMFNRQGDCAPSSILS